MKREDNFIFSIFGLERVVEEEKGNSRERKFNFSLDFSVFGSSVLVRPRSKVVFRSKDYAWTPVLWIFDNSRRKGFSPT